MVYLQGMQWDETPTERRAAMTWAQRLKRVFNIDIKTCSKCGGAVKVIACIENPAVIEKILAHLNEKALPVDMELRGMDPMCSITYLTVESSFKSSELPRKLRYASAILCPARL
jgi:hypothetical protein